MAKKPGKTDVRPYDASKMQYEIVTADEKGNAMRLNPQDEARVRGLVGSMSVQQVPAGGMVFVPEGKYKQIQDEISRGYLFGRKISTGNEENFQVGADRLGDGFSLPQFRMTYLNASLLKKGNEDKLAGVLAHELGHNAAWLNDPKRPDFSEAAADEYKDAYLKRGRDTQKNWNAISALPAARGMKSVLGSGGDMTAQAQPPAQPANMKAVLGGQ